jgi:hypothetical protein
MGWNKRPLGASAHLLSQQRMSELHPQVRQVGARDYVTQDPPASECGRGEGGRRGWNKGPKAQAHTSSVSSACRSCTRRFGRLVRVMSLPSTPGSR